MRHVVIIFGVVCFAALAVVVLAQASSHWHSASHIATMLRLALSEPVSANQPITAVPASPRLSIPLWSIYLGSAIVLIVAAIMLRRCQAANQCQVVKRIYRSWRE